MSARDPIAVLLGTLDRPVEPRAAFADALLEQLLGELGDGRVPARRRLRLPNLVPTRPVSRLRLALVVLAILLLLAGIATGTYFGVRSWVSSAPRGPQFTSDFAFTEIFRDETGLGAPRLGPGGSELLAFRESELVRLPGVAAATGVQPEPILDLQDLAARPELWDPGVDLGDVLVKPFPSCGRGDSFGNAIQPLAVAEDGQAFLVVGAWQREGFEVCDPPLGASVVVRQPDGSTAKALTFGELAEAVDLGVGVADAYFGVAASTPGRIWVIARSFAGPEDDYSGAYSFAEVVDPNGDGDWSDPVIRPFAVPPDVPVAERRAGVQSVLLLEMEAEPSAGLDEGAPSILVTSLGRDGQYEIYRLSDRNGDADALDEGEFEVVFTSVPGYGDFDPPAIAPRVVVSDGQVALEEIVAAGLTRRTRISRISQTGEVTDIARSFEYIGDVLAGPEGNLYVQDQIPGEEGSTWVLYRLSPVQSGQQPSSQSGQQPSSPASTPPSEAESPSGPTTAGPEAEAGNPQIAFTIESSDLSKGRIVLLGTDGGRPRQLVKGRYNHGFCQSADAARMAYFSDEEAPRESFVYLANADGSEPTKVTEQQVGFWCGFSERWLILTVQTGSAMALIRHDLESGEETGFADNVDRLALSPDGNTALYVGGLDLSAGWPPPGRESLELVDLDTLERRRLDGPLPTGMSYGTPEWSNDGTRVAYAVGPSRYPPASTWTPPPEDADPDPYTLYVRDVAEGPAVRLARIVSGPPALFWSPSGRWLLVCTANRGSAVSSEPGCAGRSQLLLIDTAAQTTRVVARGKLVFAGWRQGEDSFAYATTKATFLGTVEGGAEKLADAPRKGWPVGDWLGFSPDDGYIGLGDFDSRLAVLEVETGKVRVLYREPKDGSEYVDYRKWWREKGDP